MRQGKGEWSETQREEGPRVRVREEAKEEERGKGSETDIKKGQKERN